MENNCDEDVGEGKGNWHGYYNKPKDEKVSALADAIKGIGPSRAKDIVYSNLRPAAFTPKPRSWNAFRNEVSRIEQSLNLEGLEYEVLVKYGRNNRENLGYAGTGGSCRWERREKKFRTSVEQRRTLRTIPKFIDVYVDNAKLLSGESETIPLTFNGSTIEFGITHALNNYTLSGGNDVYQLHGVSRKPTRPALNDFQISLQKVGGKLVLHVQDLKAEELQKLSPDYKIRVSYAFYRNKWWCLKDSKMAEGAEVLAPDMYELDLSEPVFRSGKSLEAGKKYYVEDIRVERLNTEYFSDQSGSTKTGEVIY